MSEERTTYTVGPDAPSTPECDQETALELLAALWPYIRNWPLCGAALDASDAVVRAGKLLGKSVEYEASSYDAACADGFDEGVTAAYDAICEMKLEGKVGPSLAASIRDTISGVKSS